MIRLQDERHPLPRAVPVEVRAEASRVLHLDMVSAVDHPDFMEHFFRRQHACYSRFRSEAATAPHQKRTTWKGVYLIAAMDFATGELAGGVGVYERHTDAPLPVELAIGDTSPVKRTLDRWNDERVVELSGLWVEEQWRRTGLSSLLMLVAMSSSRCLGAAKAVGFSHHHVLEFYKTIGLVPDHTVGDYLYPDEKYVSTFIWGDLRTLKTAPKTARKEIEKYTRQIGRERPIFWTGTPHLLERPAAQVG
jgi:GNAT superfamily N-acetyltransferase